MMEERQQASKSMRKVQGRRARIIPGTSNKLRLFWAGPYRGMKLIALAMVEIKPVFYPWKESLVSLDV